MSKNQFVDKLKEGDRVDTILLVKASQLAETRAGKPYLRLTLADRSGEIQGPVWDRALELQPVCAVGAFIHVIGQVQSYRDSLQLKIESVQGRRKEEVNLADFLVSCSGNRQQMADELQRLVLTLDNPWLKKLLNRFFKSDPCWSHFQEAPAAKSIHHAYVGGLLEHSLSVARLADKLASHYPGVDRSLLLAGALLHDIGKLEELKMETAVIDYTVRGRLKGHLVIGSEMVGMEAAEIKDFPTELLEQLQHLILSHHGRQEFGSPTVPMTIEGFLLSFIDDLDAKMNLMEQLRKKIDQPEMGWSDYQRSLERFLYLGPLPAEDEKQEALDSSTVQRQPTLF
ncbi:MAG: HD domain-containing protein [Thermodesulfobacteriota bacterium]